MDMFFISLLLTIGNTMGNELCENSPFSLCSIHDFKVPETIQDLNNICPKLLVYIDCLGNYNDACHDEPGFTIVFTHGDKEFASIRRLIVGVCSENTTLHTAVFENIKCLKEHFFNPNETCYDVKDQVMDALHTETRSQDEENVKFFKKRCVSRLYEMACFVSSVSSNCDVSARMAALEIIQQSYFLREVCNHEISLHVTEELENLNINSVLKDSLRDAFILLSQTQQTVE